MVKIWERNCDLISAGVSSESLGLQEDQSLAASNNSWSCTANIGGKHNGPIWRIEWANPEFGSIVASCGND